VARDYLHAHVDQDIGLGLGELLLVTAWSALLV
jgi:hypothetical protein